MTPQVGTTTGVPRERVLDPLPLLDEEAMLSLCRERKINTKHCYTMWRHVIANGVTDVSTIPGLPKALVALVQEKFALTTSKLLEIKTSEDKSTSKLLIQLQDGAKIETVIMRYGRFELRSFPEDRQREDESGQRVFQSKGRATVCVSSQVGCKMGCTFCATGTMGLLSNLMSGEILEQLYHANTVEPIRNVVFMGMGEPLDNYTSVVSAAKAMADVQRFSLSPNRIAISTVGVVPRMRQLANDLPQVGLALSLHAPNQEMRTKIVPTSKAWHIDKIMAAMDYFVAERAHRANHRRSHVLIEYVLIDGVNSDEDTARELGLLLGGRDVIVNVIPYNPTDVPFDYKPPSREVTEAFNAVLRDEFDIRTIIRQELGQDVNAACGQLVIESQKEGATGSCSTGDRQHDVEDLGASANSQPLRPPTKAEQLAKIRQRNQAKQTKAKAAALKTAKSQPATPAQRTQNTQSRLLLVFAFLVGFGLLRLLLRFMRSNPATLAE
eukprot:m.32659 g.32659  ORF g.32659 m.32659 type:complete len:496 (-) comp9543_c0_seq1:217-1704(-)